MGKEPVMDVANLLLAMEVVLLALMVGVLLFRLFAPADWRRRFTNAVHHRHPGHS